MVLSIEKKDNKFRVKTQDFSIDWLPVTELYVNINFA
jgi:hypothetical protein